MASHGIQSCKYEAYYHTSDRFMRCALVPRDLPYAGGAKTLRDEEF